MLFQHDAERVLWEATDTAVFGPGSPVEAFKAATDRLTTSPGNFGRTLKNLRRALAKTPTEAAQEAGMKASRWRHLEANTALATTDELAAVCQTLKLDTEARRTLLREQRRAPAAYLERSLQSWRRNAKRVARSTGPSREFSLEVFLEELEPAVREALLRWAAAHGRDTTMSLEDARELSPVARREWVAEVLSYLDLP